MTDWTERLRQASATAKAALVNAEDETRHWRRAGNDVMAGDWQTHADFLSLAARVLRRLAEDRALLSIEQAAQHRNLRDGVPWSDAFRAALCAEEAPHAD